MKLALVHLSAAACPYRLLDDADHEIAWANDFLDAQHLRQLSPRSLRAYAYDLLHFIRWFQSQSQALSEITESTLLDYVRHQLSQQPQPTPQTVNHRLTVIRCLYRFHLGQEIPSGHSHFQRTYATRCPVGYGRPHRNVAFGLRLKQPRRVIQPLSAEQVSRFWASFRTFRDFAVVGLMLLDGLRSCEILSLQLEDLKLTDAQLRVLGKGRKQRTVPLPAEIMEVLQSYLRLERPLTNSPYLFISLKGRRRGQPMTPAGLRSLFRHHRLRSTVPPANPHRFRHTFGADMVRAGISLPALQHLMGHSQIQTTMLYVELAPQAMFAEAIEVFRQALKVSAGDPRFLSALGHAYAISGQRTMAEEFLVRLKEQAKKRYVAPYDIAVVYAGLKQTDQSFKYLENAYQDRSFWMCWMKTDPRFDGIRGDPRYHDLLRRMHLTP